MLMRLPTMMQLLRHLQTTHDKTLRKVTDDALQVSRNMIYVARDLYPGTVHNRSCQLHHETHCSQLHHEAHHQLQLSLISRQLRMMYLEVSSLGLARPAHHHHLQILLCQTMPVLSATVRQAAGGQYFGI